MLDALCFALFGKAFRNINKPTLVNSINQKDCIVEVEFDTNNKSYRIVRGIKPNIFEIYENSLLLNQDAAARDYQEYLENFILKLNYKSFTQIVILGSASFVPFMQLSAADRRSIIEDLLDIQIFSTMNGVVKDRITQNKDQILLNKNQYEIANTKYDIQQKHINQLKQNNEDKINEYLEDIRSNNNSIQKISFESANTLNQIESLSKLVSDKTSIETKLKKITKIESQIESNISKYRTDISFFQHNDDCPTCRQEIPLGFKEQQIEQYSSKVEECLSGLKQIEVKIVDEQTRLNSITETQKKIQQLQIKIATNNTSIVEIEKYISKLENSIKNLTSVKENLYDEDTKLISLNSELKALEVTKVDLIERKVTLMLRLCYLKIQELRLRSLNNICLLSTNW